MASSWVCPGFKNPLRRQHLESQLRTERNRKPNAAVPRTARGRFFEGLVSSDPKATGCQDRGPTAFLSQRPGVPGSGNQKPSPAPWRGASYWLTRMCRNSGVSAGNTQDHVTKGTLWWHSAFGGMAGRATPRRSTTRMQDTVEESKLCFLLFQATN